MPTAKDVEVHKARNRDRFRAASSMPIRPSQHARRGVLTTRADRALAVVASAVIRTVRGDGWRSTCASHSVRQVTLRTLINAAGRRLPVGGGFPVRQKRPRAGPFTGPDLPGTSTPPRAGHGRAGRGRRHRRSSTHPRLPRTPADQTRPGTTGRSGADPATVTEVKRSVNLLTRTWHSTERPLHWHTWQRRHQARAR